MTRLVELALIASIIISFPAVIAAQTVDGFAAAGAESGQQTGSSVRLDGGARPSFGDHEIADSRVALRFDADRLTVDELRVEAWGQTVPTGLSWHVGAVGYDAKRTISTGTFHADLGGIGYERAEPVAGDLSFLLDVDLSLSVLESTTTGLLGGSAAGVPGNNGFYLCGSASELALQVGAEYAGVALVAMLEMRRDPFHFGDGNNCLGHPPSYSTADRRGIALRWTFERFFVVGTLEHVEETSYVDVAESGQDHGGERHRDEAAHDFQEDAHATQWLGAVVAGLRW